MTHFDHRITKKSHKNWFLPMQRDFPIGMREIRVAAFAFLQAAAFDTDVATTGTRHSKTSFDFTYDDAIIERAACDEGEGIWSAR
jgi:hypothetical protein